MAEERDLWAAEGRRFEFITKWNPRRQDKEDWVAHAEATGVIRETWLGKRVGLLDLQVERAWKKHKRHFRLIVEVTERTIDKHGQHLLTSQIELQGWWTSLSLPAAEVIEQYQHRGTHEQFHSAIKSDLDLERLSSVKSDTNDCVLRLSVLAYNWLRLISQLGLTGEIAPIRHPAKRTLIEGGPSHEAKS